MDFEEFVEWKKERNSRAGDESETVLVADAYEMRELRPAEDERLFITPHNAHLLPSGSRDVLRKAEKEQSSFLAELKLARMRLLVAGCFLVVMSIVFAIVGTMVPFWRDGLTTQGWITLYTLICLMSSLMLEMWDVSLSFFVANCVLLYAGALTLQEALIGFANESIIAIGAMFILAKAVERVRILDYVVQNVLKSNTSVRMALLRVLPACALLSAFTNNTPVVAVMIPVLEAWSIR